jgi:hypothetical protein
MKTPITNSSMQKMMTCEEKWRLSVIERLRPRSRPAYFALGTAVHAGIEMSSPEHAADVLVDNTSVPWTDEEHDALAYDCGTVRAMVTGALRRWLDRPTIREHQFTLPLINPETGGTSRKHTLSGVLDGLYPERNMVEEYKTSANVSRDYIDRLDLDFQVSTYCQAASQLLGRPVRKVRYRVIEKPGIKPRKGETEQEYVQRALARKPLAPLKQRKTETDDEYAERSRAREEARTPLKRKVAETPTEWGNRVMEYYTTHEGADARYVETIVTRSDEQMERWRHEAWELHQRMMGIEGGKMTIRNTSSCLLYRRRCAFLDLCCGEVGIDYYEQTENAHPELAAT